MTEPQHAITPVPEPRPRRRVWVRRVVRAVLVVAGSVAWAVGAARLLGGTGSSVAAFALIIGGFAVAMLGLVGLKGSAQAVAEAMTYR